MAYRAVVFDVFGTILKIQDGVHPYRQLLREGIHHGRRPRSDDAARIMTFNGSLSACADALEVQVKPERLVEIEAALEEEVAGIEAFQDALDAVAFLQQYQLRVGVCSNLAQPYAQAVRRHFPTLDAYTFSFELGTVKPDLEMYRSACTALKVDSPQALGSQHVVMIGDSLQCDCYGPRGLGMTGVHLERSPSGKIKELMRFAELVVNTR